MIRSLIRTTARRVVLAFAAVFLLGSTASAQQLTINKILNGNATAGQVATFDITVENNTGASADGAIVTDNLSASFNALSVTTTCTANTLGTVCPSTTPQGSSAITLAIPTFPAGGKVTIQIKAKLNSNATGTTSNTATAANAANGSAISTSTTGVPIGPGGTPTLTITKTQSASTLAIGTPITYTVTVENTSAVDAVGYSITDYATVTANTGTAPTVTFDVTSGNPVPCVSLAGAACPIAPNIASGALVTAYGFPSALFNSQPLTIPANTKWRFTYTLKPKTIANGCGYTSISLNNFALVGSLPSSAVIAGPLTGLTSTTCVVAPTPTPLDIGVTKIGVLGTSGTGQPQITYTMTATNYSSIAADNLVGIYDQLLFSGSGISGTMSSAGWTIACTGTGGAACPAFALPTPTVPIGSYNNLFFKTIGAFPAGSSLAITLTVPVKVNAACGPATVNVDNRFGVYSNNSLYSIAPITPHKYYADAAQQTIAIPQKSCVDLSAQKVVSKPSYAPGEAITFNIAVSNSGTSTATNVPFEDLLPAGVTFVSASCAASGTASCGGSPSFTSHPDKVSLTIASLPPGGLPNKVTITINAKATTSASLFGGKTNTVVIPSNPTGGSYLDTDPSSNTTSQNFNIRGTADVSIKKTGSCGLHELGAAASYTLVITNNGPDEVVLAKVNDPAVTNLTLIGATCAASASPLGVCPTGTAAAMLAALQSTSGLSIPSLASGASVTLTLSGTFGTTATNPSATNTATVTLPSAAYNPDTNPLNNSDSCTSAAATAPLVITKTIAGAEAGTQGAVTVTASCGGLNFGPFTLAPNSAAGTYTLATIPNLPIGVSCVVKETATGVVIGSTVSTTYTTSSTGSTVGSGVNAQITVASGAVPSSVAFSNTYPAVVGSLAITKTIAGNVAGTQGAVVINATCGGTIYGPYTVAAGSTGTTAVATINNIPKGVVCTVNETATGANGTASVTTSYTVNAGASQTGSSASTTIVQNQTATVAWTNSYSRLLGSLTIQKTIAGTAAGQQGAIQFNVLCGSTNFGPYTLAAGATGTQTIATVGSIPAGSTCTVSEIALGQPTNITATTSVTVNAGAAVSADTASAVIAASATQAFAFVNSYEPAASTDINGQYTSSCTTANGALSGAVVSLVGSAGGATYTTTTSASGTFLLSVPAGTYTLSITSTDPSIPVSVQTVVVPVGGNAVTATVTVQNCAVPTIAASNLLGLMAVLALLGWWSVRRRSEQGTFGAT